MKQTAVEWLIEQLENHNGVTKSGFENVIQQAKAMEKDRMIDFHVNCCEDGYNLESDKLLTEDVKLDIKAHAEQYYNETFKSE